MTSLGEAEQLILLAILRLGEDAYGVSIQEELAERTGRIFSIGALYTSLSRLESKQLIESRTGEPTAQRGGRAKRLISVTPAGRAALTAAQQAYAALLQGLDLLGNI
jgi:DNA-binding PadR family transcriptional regulator